MLAILLALLAAVPGDGRVPLDSIELEGGAKLQGRVVFEDATQLVVRVGTSERVIPRQKVLRFDSRAARVRGIWERWRALGEQDLAGALDLAREARAAGLEHECRLFALHVLARAPQDAAAHELLDHELRGTSWFARDGVRQWSWEKLRELRKEWRDAWELSSEHYRVRSNLPLGDAVCAVMEMEGAYRAFYDLLGSPLELREQVEPLQAQVHADLKSFPELAGGSRSYFDAQSHTLLVNAAGGFERGAVVHESTHQLLDACLENTAASRGDVPGWLNEGLAEFLRASTGGPAGRSRFFADSFDLARFKEHAAARDPYDLGRVLNLQSDDFLGSSNTALKYAQAYTLVCWGLHGEEGKLRERFFDYLREACRGHSSSTAFKDALRLDARAVEKSWTAFVRAKAGTK